jgi:hypothetical protein
MVAACLALGWIGLASPTASVASEDKTPFYLAPPTSLFGIANTRRYDHVRYDPSLDRRRGTWELNLDVDRNSRRLRGSLVLQFAPPRGPRREPGPVVVEYAIGGGIPEGEGYANVFRPVYYTAARMPACTRDGACSVAFQIAGSVAQAAATTATNPKRPVAIAFAFTAVRTYDGGQTIQLQWPYESLSRGGHDIGFASGYGSFFDEPAIPGRLLSQASLPSGLFEDRAFNPGTAALARLASFDGNHESPGWTPRIAVWAPRIGPRITIAIDLEFDKPCPQGYRLMAIDVSHSPGAEDRLLADLSGVTELQHSVWVPPRPWTVSIVDAEGDQVSASALTPRERAWWLHGLAEKSSCTTGYGTELEGNRRERLADPATVPCRTLRWCGPRGLGPLPATDLPEPGRSGSNLGLSGVALLIASAVWFLVICNRAKRSRTQQTVAVS